MSSSSAMRLITWNCARGPLARKLTAVHALDPDIVVLTEAPAKGRPADGHWAGSGPNGILVQARGDYRVEPLPQAELPPCVVPFRVRGPRSFTLLAVWTWPAPSYKAAFKAGVDAYRELPGPFVIAGDFNGNPAFDKPRTRLRWGSLFEGIDEMGLASAYHVKAGERFGAESAPTHYFRWKEDAPFHIDFAFVPKNWLPGLRSVTVGSFEDWKDLSDHRPITVDFASPSPVA